MSVSGLLPRRRTTCLMLFCFLLTSFSPSSFALNLNDDTGHALTLSAPAQRIISLAPSITENLFAIGVGERIVGTSSASNFPETAKSIPVVADYQSLDLERIVALKPDVIVVWQGGNSPAQLAALERLNIPIYHHRVETLADIPTALMRLAQLTGTEATAADIILKSYQRLPLLADATQPALSAFFQVWDAPLMTLGKNSWVTDAMSRCGAHNIFDNLSIAAPTVNIEDVLMRKPALLITATANAQADASLDAWKKWRELPAVKANAFIFTDADTMNRATLRTLDSTQAMCAQIAEARLRLK